MAQFVKVTVEPESDLELVAATRLVEPSTVAETRLVEPSTVAETRLVEPSTVAATRLVEPSTVAETRLVEPSTVAATRLVKPSTVAETRLVEPSPLSATRQAAPLTVAGPRPLASDSVQEAKNVISRVNDLQLKVDKYLSDYNSGNASLEKMKQLFSEFVNFLGQCLKVCRDLSEFLQDDDGNGGGGGGCGGDSDGVPEWLRQLIAELKEALSNFVCMVDHKELHL